MQLIVHMLQVTVLNNNLLIQNHFLFQIKVDLNEFKVLAYIKNRCSII